ncbi:MAG: exonuclease domain-containing protein [Eubacterium sp.]|nr:exonuclease domain-containing protein [Eubacterium sp.]
MKNEKNTSKSIRPYKGINMLKLADKYTVVDIETTGLSPHYDAIIELSALKVEDGTIVDEFSELVNPGGFIPNFITELTGITNEMVEKCLPISDVLPKFLEFVKNSLIVGHNVNFDINFIYDNATDFLDVPFPNDFVDTMRISRRLIDGLPHYKLQNLAEYFKVDYSGAHRALEDCKITYMCYEKLKKIVSDNPEKADALKYDRYYSSTRARNVHTDVLDFDEEHPLFGKVCVITGELSMTRAEAMQAIADVGGINADGITKKTNYLIVGGYEYSKYGTGFKSTKRKKAEEYKLKGMDIEIISEDVFLSMLSENKEGQNV